MPRWGRSANKLPKNMPTLMMRKKIRDETMRLAKELMLDEIKWALSTTKSYAMKTDALLAAHGKSLR